MAKKINDRSTVKVQNPLSGMLQSQLDQQQNGMVKNLASSFLSSELSVVEYDIKQAMAMQGGVIFNMAFMWVLHFKMEQVQPLLIQVVTGFMQLVYSPLFQVYVMGRNLERPFKTPMVGAQKFMQAQKASAGDDEKESEEDMQSDGGDEEESDNEEENTEEEEEDDQLQEEEDGESDGDEDDEGSDTD